MATADQLMQLIAELKADRDTAKEIAAKYRDERDEARELAKREQQVASDAINREKEAKRRADDLERKAAASAGVAAQAAPEGKPADSPPLPGGYYWREMPITITPMQFTSRSADTVAAPTFADEFALLARKHFPDLFELRVDWNTGSRVRVRAFTASYAASEAAAGVKDRAKSHRRRVKEVLGEDPDDGREVTGKVFHSV